MKSRMLISMLVIALAAAVIGGATMAWFTDSDESTPVTFTAGTLLIDLTEPQLTQEFAEKDMGILNPGDTWEYEFEVKNVGTKSFHWALCIDWEDIIGQLNENLDVDIRNLLIAKQYGSKKLSEVINWTIEVDDGSGYRTITIGVPPGIGFTDFKASSNPVKFKIVFSLPEDTGNDYQGSTMKLKFGVMAWQTTNNAPKPANPFAPTT